MYRTKLAGMRLSLSKKEVAEIHLMLTTLPIPPIPVVLTMVYEHLEDSELKAAFEMATSSLVQDARTDDGIVNSHSIIAALSLFAKWSASTGANPLKKQEEMQNNKDASLLRIISSVLDYNDNTTTGLVVDAKDDEILQIFIKASQEWINTYLPDDISVTIRPAPNNKTIGFEHDLHIAMAHYCYSQGVLYNSKKSTLMCKVHDGLYNDFLEKQKNATEDDDANQILGGETETAACAVEHMEIAAMYSQFPYHKMNGWAGEPDVHGMVDKEEVRALLERQDINGLNLLLSRAPAFQQNLPEGSTSTEHEWVMLGDMAPMNALHALAMRCSFRCDHPMHGVGGHGITDCKHAPSVQELDGLDRSIWDTH